MHSAKARHGELMSNSIVVTGATGNIGQGVVAQLAARKANVTALVRSSAKAASLADLGARLVEGTFEDRASLERAFTGADTIVLITAANANAAEQTITAIDAAKAAGVRKIVRISALKASVDGPTDNTRQHGRTEDYLKASGIAHVILRPHFFMQVLLGSLPSITSEGKFYFGVGQGRLGTIDSRDISDAAVAAATSDEWNGQTLEITGPAAIDFTQVAMAFSRALGREVAYVAVPPAAVEQALLGHGADAWTASIVRDYCAAYAEGFGDFATDNVQRLTGHAPRSIDDFAREVLAPLAKR